jgi:hypothetical protein
MNKFCHLLATNPLTSDTGGGVASTFGSNAPGGVVTTRSINGRTISAAAKFSF